MSTTATLPSENPDDNLLEAEQDQQQKQEDDGLYHPSAGFPWNEDMPKEMQDQLVKLAAKFCDEFRYPRRLQVMNSWRGRMYWREMQHLSWNWEGDCWDVLGPAGWSEGAGGANQNRDSAVLYSTNIYQGFGKAFIAVITRATPNLRFEPEDVEDAADIETAKVADDLKKLIQHENDPVKLMTKAAYYGWTDGIICGRTWWGVDKRTGKPREMQCVEGALEVKVPVIYGEMCDYPYLQYSNEYHQSTVRAKVKARNFDDPDFWKKIKGGSHGNGQDIYERTARISVKQGISMLSAGGDMYGHLITTQCTWMRPTVFLDDCVDEKYRDNFESIFPNGCYLEVDNGTYTGSRDANMDDEWTVENIMEGDGSFRNAEGTCMMSVQERVNDIINATQDIYEKTLPASHWNQKMFDVDGMRRQKSSAGARYGVNMEDMPSNTPGGTPLQSQVFYEPAATVSADMLQYLEKLMTEVPEGLTGLSAVLWGVDTGDKSGKALSIQQSAAMGLIGLPFKVMKRLYAGMMEQAVRCACRNRKEDFKMGVPDDNGRMETIAVRVESLNGNVRCYPDSDENYPEDWISKRNTYMQLMMEGNTDPTLKAILSNPENQALAKRLIGLQELTLPDEASWNKQMVEINIMLQEPPTPPQPQPPQQVPNPLVPHITETVQPPPIPARSSLPIDPIYDNNAAEFLTVTIWINSPKGQAKKKSDPIGFQNVRLHGLEHKQALLASMPPPPPAPNAAPPHSAPPHAAPPPPAGGAGAPAAIPAAG